MLQFIRNLFAPRPAEKLASKPSQNRQPIRIGARYDATQTGSSNRRHWAAADDRGPNNANDTNTRSILCRRARYERDNDPHVCGLTKTLAHDLIGTGPRLDLPFSDEALYEPARLVELRFARHCKAIDFGEKLRLLVEPRATDGETFGMFTNNPNLDGVQLDFKAMEQEQVATPGFSSAVNGIDGIEFDSNGNPTHYHVLDEHPGEMLGSLSQAFTRVPASQMVHWFRPSRPGQARGVSEFASSLETGAQTRRYSLAVLGKAEICANITGVMETENVTLDDAGEPVDVKAMDEVDFPRMSMLTLPGGFKAKTFEPGQNTTGYTEYIGEKRREMARPVLAPFNVMTGNSSGYNYSSGRLDHVPYHRVIWIERERLAAKVLNKFFLAWYREALAVGLIPSELPPIEEWNWDWQWDAFDSIDPVKDAAAWKELITLKIATRTEACAARGLRFREVIDTLAAEEAYMRSKGLDPAVEPAPVMAPATPAKKKPSPADDEDTTLETDSRWAGVMRV